MEDFNVVIEKRKTGYIVDFRLFGWIPSRTSWTATSKHKRRNTICVSLNPEGGPLDKRGALLAINPEKMMHAALGNDCPGHCNGRDNISPGAMAREGAELHRHFRHSLQ